MNDHPPRSACYGDTRFTSNNSADIDAARRICDTCTFRACKPVLAEALAHPTDGLNLEGVYDGRYYSPKNAGSSKATRTRDVNAHRGKRPPCGTEAGYQWHRHNDRRNWPLPKGDPCGCRAAHAAAQKERDEVAA